MRTMEKNYAGELYWTVDMIQEKLNVSRAAAYQLLSAVPDGYKVRIIDQETRYNRLAGARKYILALHKARSRRGNPLFRDPVWQKNNRARRR